MKRASVILFLFTIILPLSASFYSSNALGQKKELIASLDQSGWVLETKENEEILYHDGNEVKRKTVSGRVTVLSEGGREETIIRNEEGLIERRIITEDGKKEEYNYFYSGSLLTSYNYSLDSELVEKVEYITTDEGLLLYYRVKDRGVYITQRYFVDSSGRKVSILSSPGENEIITKETPDGGYIESSSGREYTYDKNGRIVKEKGGETLIEYSYNEDGTLEERKETTGERIIVTEYGEREVISTYTTDGVKISERTERDDGTIEEKRYIDGEARYYFLYDRDGRRLMEAGRL